MNSKRFCLPFLTAGLAALVGLLVAAPSAQLRPGPVVGREGHVGLGLLLRRLNTVATVMMATAHPDDESNAVLALARHGLGARVALVSATRGDGGQNEIGSELFDALAVLRTEELLAAHRFDGAEQYFTRAVDFGYSFNVEETFELWGREEILGDFVRHIRTLRPDVILAMRPDGEGGGQHHQASARLAREAFRAAADPTRFSQQISEGLRPWQAATFYFAAGFGAPGTAPTPAVSKIVELDVGRYDPLLGRTYAEIGSEARSMHKCQGMPQLLPLPGQTFRGPAARYYLADSVQSEPAPGGASRIPNPESPAPNLLFEGLDTTLPGLTRFVKGAPPERLATALAEIARQGEAARMEFERRGAETSGPALLAGLTAVRELRAGLPAMAGLDDHARFEIDFRLQREENDFEQAALLAYGVRFEALADDGVVVPDQGVTVTLVAANRGRDDFAVETVALGGFGGAPPECGGRTVKAGGVLNCTASVRIPAAAKVTTPYFRRLPDKARYVFDADLPFGLPFRPTPFTASVGLRVRDVRVSAELPVEYRYDEIFAGEKRMELHVVPAFAVRVSPEIVVLPAHASPSARSTPPAAGRAKFEVRGFPPTRVRALGAAGTSGATGGPVVGGREVRVTVTNGAKGSVSGEVALELPAGWRATPSAETVSFTREDETQTRRFVVTPPSGGAAGEFRIRAVVRAVGARYDRGYQVVEYPHIHRRHLEIPAETVVRVVDVAVAPNLTVGYVMGVGDEVPQAIEQLGARVQLIGPDELAWGDLTRYPVIVTGIRAYEKRADLRANNTRLLTYVEQGGALIVQYNRVETNEGQFWPYPVRVGASRVTSENAPVTVLVPDHPVFNRPNKIGGNAWTGWVQERGLYFLDEKGRDARYVDLVAMEDPFEYNKGVKKGALVEARYGKGRWVYVGLGLWRQVAAGTAGAYQLLANLISLGQVKTGSMR